MKDPDEVDGWGIQWAHQRRIMLGIVLPEKLEPIERLGKLRSTLGQIQKDKVGAGERTLTIGLNGHRNQDWPEVYRGTALIVHRIYMRMPQNLREIMDLHYVWREIPVRIKAEEIKVSVPDYWRTVWNAKSFLHGAVICSEEYTSSRI